MGKLSCAFFGHRNFDYKPYENKIREVVVDLIHRGVTEFYNGYRGRFDGTCARIVHELQQEYPQIKNIMVLSYIPNKQFEKPEVFDETVYLLETSVPMKYAIFHTNRKLVQTVKYIVSGVAWRWGGAKTTCDYAKGLCKTIFYIVDDIAYNDCEWSLKDFNEKIKNEEYRQICEKENVAHYELTRQQVEANIANHKKKRKNQVMQTARVGNG